MMEAFSFALKTASYSQNTSSREVSVWCGFESELLPMLKVEASAQGTLLSYLEIRPNFPPFDSTVFFEHRLLLLIHNNYV